MCIHEILSTGLVSETQLEPILSLDSMGGKTEESDDDEFQHQNQNFGQDFANHENKNGHVIKIKILGNNIK